MLTGSVNRDVDDMICGGVDMDFGTAKQTLEEKMEPTTVESQANSPREAEKRVNSSPLDAIAKSIQIVSVVVGVVISVVSYTSALNRDSLARQAEADRYRDQRRDEEQKRRSEAARSFVELRQEFYLDAVKTAAIIANPEDHAPEELKSAIKRFRQLYVAELTLVEGFGVETHMKDLADALGDPVADFTPVQLAAYNLAHALRDSLRKSWSFEEALIDNPNN